MILQKHLNGLPLRVYFFLFVGAGALVMPFLDIYLSRQGLTGVQIGFVRTVGSLAMIAASPMWGQWSAKVSRVRIPLMVALAISTSAIALLAAFGNVLPTVFLAVLTIIFWSSHSGAFPMSEALAVRIEGRERYGSIRFWGSLGWAVIALGAGFVAEWWGIRVSFWVYALVVLTGIIMLQTVTIPLQERIVRQPDAGPRPNPLNILREKPEILRFAIVICLIAFVDEGTNTYEPLFLDQLGTPESWIGYLFALGALVELPILSFGTRIIGRWGAVRTMMLSLVLEIIRMVLIMLFPVGQIIVLLRALKGISYALRIIALVDFLSQRVTQRGMATTLGLFNVTLAKSVALFAAPLTGWMFDNIGALSIYGLSAVGQTIALIVLVSMLGMPSSASDKTKDMPAG